MVGAEIFEENFPRYAPVMGVENGKDSIIGGAMPYLRQISA
jgi:hypothetical protein